MRDKSLVLLIENKMLKKKFSILESRMKEILEGIDHPFGYRTNTIPFYEAVEWAQKIAKEGFAEIKKLES